MKDTKQITTCFVSKWLEIPEKNDSIVVVIDLLRATSVISTAFIMA